MAEITIFYSGQIVMRYEAKRLGLKRYFTGGGPCKHGHIAERLTSNGACIECANQRIAVSRQTESEKWSEYNRRSYWKNPEAGCIRAHRRRKEEPKAVRASEKRWKDANPERVLKRALADTALRRARKRGAPGTHTPADIDRLVELQCGRCAHPGCRKSIRKVRHVDHIVPLARGGSNGVDNLQLLCPEHNMAKGAKDPIEYARENGRLF